MRSLIPLFTCIGYLHTFKELLLIFAVGLKSLNTLAHFSGAVFSRSYRQGSMMRADKRDGSNQAVFRENLGRTVRDVKIFDGSRKKGVIKSYQVT